MTDYKQALTAAWPLINSIAGQRFASDTLAEEAALYVLNRLEEDDYHRLRAFSGRAKFSTYLSSLCIRLLEDFSRKKYGRLRPPTWVTDLGGIWLVLFRLLCLQRLAVADAVETVIARSGNHLRAEVENAAWKILERIIHCGRHQGSEVSLDDPHGKTLQDQAKMHSAIPNPEQQVLTKEREIFFELLFSGNTQGISEVSAESVFTDKVSLDLDAQERLLLKLCFQDDLSVTRAGEMLGLNANQVHGKLRRLLSRLRHEFDRAGISDELRQLLHAE
ncbi:MAG TPA: hypothetical protein ENK84_01645 [Desulfobulbus sp.]|nr:hypothetical protein [Desulfobulbus sp.]